MSGDRAADCSAQLCTFRIGRLLLGVDIMKVQEVLLPQEMTRVPLASRAVGGLINLRGQIATAIDLRWQLGLQPRSTDDRPMNVVVRTEDGAVSLLVDRIGDIVAVRDSAFEDPPATIAPPIKRLIHGVYKLEHQLLLFLDVDRAARVALDPSTPATSHPHR